MTQTISLLRASEVYRLPYYCMNSLVKRNGLKPVKREDKTFFFDAQTISKIVEEYKRIGSGEITTVSTLVKSGVNVNRKILLKHARAKLTPVSRLSKGVYYRTEDLRLLAEEVNKIEVNKLKVKKEEKDASKGRKPLYPNDYGAFNNNMALDFIRGRL